MSVVLIGLFLFLASGVACADMFESKLEDGSVLFTNVPTKPGKKIYEETAGASQQTVSLAGGKSPVKQEYSTIAEEKARKHSVDPKLVKAVIRAESNWNPKAVSPKGAKGMMQLMPKTASDLGVSDVFDPEENIEGGVRYLRFLLDKFDGNVTLALAAYNAGPARVEKVNGVPAIPETLDYVKKIVNDYSGLGGYGMLHMPRTQVKIRKIVLQDGSILFTNTAPAKGI